MIIKRPITQEQLDQKYLRDDVRFQEDLNLAYDYVITDLMTRVSDLEREADNDDRGADS